MEQKWDPQQIILEQLYIYIKKKKKKNLNKRPYRLHQN